MLASVAGSPSPPRIFSPLPAKVVMTPDAKSSRRMRWSCTSAISSPPRPSRKQSLGSRSPRLRTRPAVAARPGLARSRHGADDAGGGVNPADDVIQPVNHVHVAIAVHLQRIGLVERRGGSRPPRRPNTPRPRCRRWSR